MSTSKRLGVYFNQLQPLSQNESDLNQNLTSAQIGANTIQVKSTATGSSVELPVSEGGWIKTMDLAKVKLDGGQGLRAYDPGYTNTVACISKISFIDGDKGILQYRGYPIEQLADKADYFETAYLVVYGELPTKDEYKKFRNEVMRHSELPQPVIAAIEALPADAHPMGVVMVGLSALSTCHPEQNPAMVGQSIYSTREVQDKQIVRLIGKMPTIAAYAYHRSTGRTPTHPNQNLGYAENFLYMLDANHDMSYRPNPTIARALEVLFILHAEHEMNCSTAAARHLASSGVDVYTSIAGAIGALYGPLHGGANEAVLRMLERIQTKENIPKFLEGVKNKSEKLFGFGHRVYKNFDPRSKVIRDLAEDVFKIAGRDPLIDIALELMNRALEDKYFVDRKLYPNVDFFSGLVYRALGFNPQFFTVLFGIPRVTGYLAHWREQLTDKDTKILRPQQDYRGYGKRDYVDVQNRSQQSAAKFSDLVPSNAYMRRIAGLST